MKSLRIIAAAAIGFLIGSCTVEKSQNPRTGELVLSAYSEASATKSSRDPDGTFYWSPEDQISLFYVAGENGGALFRSKNEKRERVKEFYGTIDTDGAPAGSSFWGVYPYNTVNSLDGTFLITEVPARQTAAEWTFADRQFVSIGRSRDLSMQFYHLCGGIKFFLQEEGITRITLQDGQGTPLAGIVKVNIDGEGHPFVSEILCPESEIVLTPPQGERCFRTWTDYFIVTLPVSFRDGFDVQFEKADDGMEGMRHVGVDLTIHRAKFQWSAQPFDAGVEFLLQVEPETFDIVNPQVRRYLEEVDYSSDPEYTLSYVANYTGSDKPEPVYVNWDGPADRIAFSTSPSFNRVCAQVSVSASPAKVYNLIPDVVYYYRVYDGKTIVKEDCLKPVGPLRMVYGVSKNVRDLGGWKAGDRTIRYGRIFRGARLDDIQSKPEEKDVLLNTLHVDVDLDLRGLPPGTQGGSGEYNPWMPEDPVTYCNIQLWHYFYPSAQQYKVPVISDGTSSEQYQYAIRTIIGWLKEGKVVYFHCHGGSDRTGTLAFLIEALLGVSEEDLSKDYELTYFSGSNRKRNCSTGWFYRPMVKYIRTFAPNATITEQATAWAKTRHSDAVDPLTDEELDLLKSLMLE